MIAQMLNYRRNDGIGTLGNLCERLIYAEVLDYLDVALELHWLEMAEVSISIGTGIILRKEECQGPIAMHYD